MENNVISIEQIMSLCGIRIIRRTGKELIFRCPHCGSPKGKLKCSANIEKNVYHCFQCDNGGNGIDLYMTEMGFSGTRKEAWKEIKKQLEDPFRVVEEEKPYAFEDIRPAAEAKRVSDDVIDRTYRTMLSMLSLAPEHKQDLFRRSLTEEEIEEGLFATLPNDRTGICRKLLYAGCRLKGVPGFFENRRGDWELLGRPGYCCPAFHDGKIVGIQIRVDKPIDDRKYTWLSSSNRYNGTPAEAKATFLGDPNAEEVIVTEGILKAYVIYQLLDHRRSVIGVPGVSNIKDGMEILRHHHHQIVFEAYDMDKLREVKTADDKRKVEVLKKALKKLYRECRKAGYAIYPSKWDYDEEKKVWKGNYKGMDDYLAAMRR